MLTVWIVARTGVNQLIGSVALASLFGGNLPSMVFIDRHMNEAIGWWHCWASRAKVALGLVGVRWHWEKETCLLVFSVFWHWDLKLRVHGVD